MRVISQNRKVNVPYETNIFTLDASTKIFIEKLPCDGNHYFEIGNYKTTERASEVFTEMLTASLDNKSCFYMPEE